MSSTSVWRFARWFQRFRATKNAATAVHAATTAVESGVPRSRSAAATVSTRAARLTNSRSWSSGLAAMTRPSSIAQTPEQGALPTLYAAVADLPGASFTGPGHLMHIRGKPQLIKRSAAAQDPELAARLWTLSEQLTGLR
jgi:hypothetical protein